MSFSDIPLSFAGSNGSGFGWCWPRNACATASDGTRYETQTDGAGRYRLPLRDGAYEVVPVVEGGGPPSSASVSVTVTGGMQTLDLQVDTGIR